MFHWRYEGHTVRQGFNVYPLDDEGSFGFILRIKSLMLYVRYSKRTKKINLRLRWHNQSNWSNWLDWTTINPKDK